MFPNQRNSRDVFWSSECHWVQELNATWRMDETLVKLLVGARQGYQGSNSTAAGYIR